MTPEQRRTVWVVTIICGTLLLVCAGCLWFTYAVNALPTTR